MTLPPTTLASHELRAVFPFFVTLDRDLRLVETGAAWESMRPELVGQRFTDPFDVVQPLLNIPQLDLDALAKRSGDTFLLRLRDADLSFRGQVLVREDGAVLLMTPVVLTAGEPTAGELTAGELAPEGIGQSGCRGEQCQAKKVAEEARSKAKAAARARFLFLAAMSLEIRTPLNGVLGMAGLLEQTTLDGYQQHLLGTLRQSSRTLLAIINDVLEFSRLDGGHLVVESQPFSPVTAAEAVLEPLARSAHEKGLELVLRAETDTHLHTLGDDTRFRQVLTNLVNNAIKFTPRGSVEVRLSRDADRLRCEVEDTGIGISETTLATLFSPFTQADASTSRQVGGTGLGLTISKRLVEGMGGQIGVDSELGMGSTFWVDLPLPVLDSPAVDELPPLRVAVVEPRARSRSALVQHLSAWVDSPVGVASHQELPEATFDVIFAPPALASEVGVPDSFRVEVLDLAPEGEQSSAHYATITRPYLPSKVRRALRMATGEEQSPSVTTVPAISDTPLRVLVVEDNAVNQLVGRLTLEALGVHVEVANDGREGVQFALAGGYDLVFMDCQMPDMDGYEATRRIRARLGDSLPIVAMTANAMPADRERCLAVGMNDYLTKPLEQAELERVLREVIATLRP